MKIWVQNRTDFTPRKCKMSNLWPSAPFFLETEIFFFIQWYDKVTNLQILK